MITQHKKIIANIIISLSIAVITIIMVVLLQQTRQLSQEINHQTDINQKFFRCLILIPPDPKRSTEARIKLVDTCARESRTVDL